MSTNKILAAAALCASFSSPAVQASPLTTLYDFTGGADGGNPYAPLLLQGSLLYGTTQGGGVANAGTVFTIDPATGAEVVVHSFDGSDGSDPQTGLIYAGGMLYGTTYQGGAYNGGTVFSIDPVTSVEAVIHSFGLGRDGANLFDSIIYRNGVLYGTTYGGGASGVGTVFKIDVASKREKILYSFTGDNSANPVGGLTFLHDLLYGTTEGVGGNGILFSLEPKNGVLLTLYSFTGNIADPLSTMIYKSGNLYGTEQLGGNDDEGAVFAFNVASGAETTIYSANGVKGYSIAGGVIRLGHELYGVMQNGGDSRCFAPSGCGVVFEVNSLTGVMHLLHRFRGADGEFPSASLVAQGGALYGTTSNGGRFGYGTVFKILQ